MPYDARLNERSDGLRRVWMWISRFFVFVSVAAEILVFIAQIIVVRQVLQGEIPEVGS
jgi:ABC-type microcin C transport system permease subunit YejE